MAQTLKPDVILMDASMPQLDGIEATRRISSQLPGIKVIGLSMHASELMLKLWLSFLGLFTLKYCAHL